MSALEQAGKILDVLSEEGDPLSFADLVKRTQLPKSSVYGVLGRLVKLQWVEHPDGNKYRIGLHLMELGARRLNDMDVVRRFIEVSGSWQTVPDEAIVLSVLDGRDVVYLACRNGKRPIGVQYRIGMRLPAATTASGKAVLALETDADLRERFADGVTTSPEGVTDDKTVDGLLVELAEVRERGYSIDDEETSPGMVCFGAAFQPVNGQPDACAVAISLMKGTVDPERYEQFGRDIMELARLLR